MPTRTLVVMTMATVVFAAGMVWSELAPVKKGMLNNLALMTSLLAAINAEDFSVAAGHASALAAAAARSEERQASPRRLFMPR